MFIFDRCRRSSAGMTPVKYEYNSMNPRATFLRSKNLPMGKLTNGALVTPSPRINSKLWWNQHIDHINSAGKWMYSFLWPNICLGWELLSAQRLQFRLTATTTERYKSCLRSTVHQRPQQVSPVIPTQDRCFQVQLHPMDVGQLESATSQKGQCRPSNWVSAPYASYQYMNIASLIITKDRLTLMVTRGSTTSVRKLLRIYPDQISAK